MMAPITISANAVLCSAPNRPPLPITRFGPNLYHRMLYLLEAHHYHQAVVVIEADDTDHGAVLAALDFHPAVTFEKIFSRDGTLTDIRLWTRMLPEPSLRLSSSSSLIPTLPPAASSSSEDATGVVLRPARYADAEAIRSIYAPYVKWSAISFEQRCPSANEIRARMGDFTLPWIVAVADGRGHDPPDHDVIGFCYASKLWNYERIVMTSIYISPDGQGQGLGQRLYRDLFARLRQQSVTAVIVAIDPMNHASIHLHRKVGFRPAGTIEAIGRKFDQWLPRLFMQYHL